MWYTYRMSISIGITELSRHARRYLERVRAGETVTVTDRGEPVAELRPLAPAEGGALARLIAEGRARPPESSFSEFLEKHRPLPAVPGERPLSELIIEAREDRL